MLVNADFSQRTVVMPDAYQWVQSPQSGVERVMLDRIGEEQARATSIVRYAQGSVFPRHTHLGGEEILVLSGMLTEGKHDYPEGWYLRNPPGSSHQPSSEPGALIFVKLRQMASSERHAVRVDTREPEQWIGGPGRDICPLYADGVEAVSLVRLPPGERLFQKSVSAAEMLVLNGALHEGNLSYVRGSWIRLPAGQYPDFVAGSQGVTVYLKIGRLALLC